MPLPSWKIPTVGAASLDALADHYGLARLAGESDTSFRARLQSFLRHTDKYAGEGIDLSLAAGEPPAYVHPMPAPQSLEERVREKVRKHPWRR